MAESNTLQTRISLKYDTYSNWTQNNPVLLAGEAAIVVVPGSTGAVQQEPAVLLKIGDGTKTFNQLQFVSGLAANVHTWALQAEKPSYTALEIEGLEDFIAGEIQDTDTQYQLVRVSDTSFKLQSKEKNGQSWVDVGSPITITYTLQEGNENGTVSFNGTTVHVHGLGTAAYTDADSYDVAGAADTAKGELIGSSSDASNSNTIYGAKKYAEEKAAAAQSAAEEAANSYTDSEIDDLKTELIGTGTGVSATTIKGGVTESKNYTDSQLAAKLAATYKAAGSVTFASLPQLSATEEGKVYNITDAFVTNGNFVEGAGKSYPAGTNVVCIDTGTDVFKWDVLTGMVDLSAYDTAEETEEKINTAKQDAISAASSDATTKANAAEQAAKEYADDLNTAMDSRMDAVEADKHTHSNKALLDTYTQTETNLADAVAKKHTHSNQTVIDGITSQKVAEWDAKIDDSDLADIAKTGNVADLVETPGTYIIFNCGTSSTNI